MTGTDAARREFLRGAEMKFKAQALLAEGQEAMERAAWMAVESGARKADVPQMLSTWLSTGHLLAPAAAEVLGISEHSVARWLLPRNRDRFLS